MTDRTATCSCGALRVTVTGPPASAALCNCLACQKRTGSAFGIAAFWARENVVTEGPDTVWSRVSDAGQGLDFRFCPTCGATVWWTADFKPGHIGVALGAFGDPGAFAPRAQYWTETRQPWTHAIGTLPAFARQGGKPDGGS